MLSEWEIKARSHRCARTEEPFQDGKPIYTLLFRERSGFRREDISNETWSRIKDSISPYSFWKSKYEAPQERLPEAMPRETTEILLRRLIEEDDPEQVNTRYILAVMLERKKALKQVDVRESPEEKVLIYEHAKTGEAFLIVDPRLHLDQLASVQKEVFDLLANREQTRQPEQ